MFHCIRRDGSTLNDRIIARNITVQGVTVQPNSYTVISVDMSYSGYKPVGVICLYGNNTSVFSIGNVDLSVQTAVQVTIWNNYANERTSNIILTVLYISN